MENIGIICEEYKLEKFERVLKEVGVVYSIVSNHNGAVAIKCLSEQHIIKAITEMVTQYFIDLSNKN